MIRKPLSLELAASLCGVSPNRAKKWIEKHGLKAVHDDAGGLLVNSTDLIDFLVKYNMPIPESIVPKKTKKILFVYREDAEDKKFLRYLIGFIGQLRRRRCCFIADQVSYSPDVQMKIMIFKPDLILLDAVDSAENVIAISRFVNSSREFSSIQIVAYSDASENSEYLTLLKSEGVDEVVNEAQPVPFFAGTILHMPDNDTVTESTGE